LDDQFPIEVRPQALAERLRSDPTVVVLDVREPWERDVCSLRGSLNIPLGELSARSGEIPEDRPVVVLCHHGMRSMQATMFLRSRGWETVANLAGGIDAWAREVEPTMAVY